MKIEIIVIVFSIFLVGMYVTEPAKNQFEFKSLKDLPKKAQKSIKEALKKQKEVKNHE